MAYYYKYQQPRTVYYQPAQVQPRTVYAYPAMSVPQPVQARAPVMTTTYMPTQTVQMQPVYVPAQPASQAPISRGVPMSQQPVPISQTQPVPGPVYGSGHGSNPPMQTTTVSYDRSCADPPYYGAGGDYCDGRTVTTTTYYHKHKKPKESKDLGYYMRKDIHKGTKKTGKSCGKLVKKVGFKNTGKGIKKMAK